MDDDAVLYETHRHVATVTINRPERMNAFNEDVHRRFPEIWEQVKRDGDVWVVIVTGAGERAFTTGMDVKNAAVTGGPAAPRLPTTSTNECTSRRFRQAFGSRSLRP